MVLSNPHNRDTYPNRKRILHQLLLALGATSKIEDALELCLSIAMDVIGMDCGGVYLRDDLGNYKLACAKGLSPEFVEKNRFYQGESDRIRLLRKGVPLFREYRDEFSYRIADILHEGIHSAALIPIIYKGQMISILNFASHTEDRISRTCRHDLESLAPQFANVLARIYAEAECQRARELFTIAFQNSPQWISITTLKEGVYIEVNEGFCRMLGYSREDAIGRTPIELGIWTPDTRARFTETIEEYGEVKNYEATFVRKDGRMLRGLTSAKLVNLHEEPCLISVVTDITDLREFESRLARLDKLNLVGEISASMGHEIRNPMTTVRGFLQMLENKKEYAHDREYFDLMIEELDRANGILTEFLSLAKNKPVNLSKQDLNGTIATIFPLIQANALINDLNLQLDLGSIPDLCIDEKEIRQMVLNLAQNGLEAMDPGGILRITTRLDSDRVALSIKDQGPGIDARLLEGLGTPFQTTKENGTGLGLAVCYSIATRHQAEIRVETSPSGTNVEVLFPVPN